METSHPIGLGAAADGTFPLRRAFRWTVKTAREARPLGTGGAKSFLSDLSRQSILLGLLALVVGVVSTTLGILDGHGLLRIAGVAGALIAVGLGLSRRPGRRHRTERPPD